MTKKTLKIDYADDLDFMLLGISSGSKDYKLCHFLNITLEKEFARTNDHQLITGKNNSSVHFSKFIFDDEQGHFYTLISNKTNDQYLVPEFKNIDYFMMIEPDSGIDSVELIQKINSIELVNAVFLIDVKTLKSKHNFLAVG